MQRREFITLLADDPILVDTGQYREVRDKPRPYADVQKEIANKLANAPNYTARIKTLSGQTTITTLPQEAGLTGEALATRRGAVQKQTRAAHCRPREMVEEEIAARQAALMEEEEVQPKSRRQMGD